MADERIPGIATGKIRGMTHDWLLVETLGTEPAVVAQGRRTKNLIPISAFLRRSPNLMAIQTAITETVRSGESMNTITPRNDRVIRTEPVQMSDGRMHGVQVETLQPRPPRAGPSPKTSPCANSNRANPRSCRW